MDHLISNITTYIQSLNLSPYYDTLNYICLTVLQYCNVIYDFLRDIDFQPLVEFFHFAYDFALSLQFTDFQFRLVREFSLIFLGNLLLVIIAWSIYGPRIAAKFGVSNRASRKTIEELRLSMSELQLPKEHDYKYK